MKELQELVMRWHTQRFDEACAEWSTMKLMEEVGELAHAILYTLRGTEDEVEIGREAADVVITLLALLGRNYPDIDIEYEVMRKLNILNDPSSGHRAALK